MMKRRRTRLRPFLLALSLLATVACGGEVPADDLTLEVVDGVTHVSSPATPAWGLDARPFQLAETLGDGVTEGEVAFGQPLAVATGPQGWRYVLDRHLPGVRILNAEGEPVGTVGRHGEGPGEFQSPTDLAVLGDGTLAVLDPMAFRLSFFGPDGAFRAQRRLFEPLGQFEMRGDGSLYGYARNRTPALRTLTPEVARGSGQVLVVGETGDSAAALAPRRPFFTDLEDVLLNKIFLAALPGDTLILSYQSQDRVEVWSPTGTLLRVIHRPPPFQTAPPEYGERDRGGGLRPLVGSAYDILSSGLGVEPGGGYWAVLVPQGRARFRTPMFGEPEIPDRWAIELFDREGRWLARQPLDFPATHAVLDWCSDGLYLLNHQEDAMVYRFEFRPVGSERRGSAAP
jgi:hypothetical protein